MYKIIIMNQTNITDIIYLKNNYIVQKWLASKERDENWFTKEAREDLERLLDEIDKWIGVSKPYFDVHELLYDLDNNSVKY
jgi:predicted metal-dependent hydrolase